MKLDKKNIIVTGGAGFIGSALIRNLVKNKNFNILNIDDLKYSGQLLICNLLKIVRTIVLLKQIYR